MKQTQQTKQINLFVVVFFIINIKNLTDVDELDSEKFGAFLVLKLNCKFKVNCRPSKNKENKEWRMIVEN